MKRTEYSCKLARFYRIKLLHTYTPARIYGLTLIELVIVCAIIAVLVGIVWVVYHSFREQVKVSVCFSNLKQIGIALTVYRDDHDGATAEKGKPTEWWELGLPPPGFGAPIPSLVPAYMPSEEVFYCPNPPVSRIGRIPFEVTSKHWYQVWDDNDPPFREIVKLRGEEYPVMVDPRHTYYGYDDVGLFGRWAIVLRLNQQVEWVDTLGRSSYRW